ncbi:MAG: type II and III secretion system protein [Acidobacteriota bacterium]
MAAALALSALLAPVALATDVPADVDARGFSRFVPDLSNDALMRALDRVGIRLQLHRGYVEQADAVDPRLAAMRGVVATRTFVRAAAGDAAATQLALVVARGAGDGWDVHAFGDGDLDGLADELDAAVAMARAAPPSTAVATVALSHISARTALDLLAAMGYATAARMPSTDAAGDWDDEDDEADDESSSSSAHRATLPLIVDASGGASSPRWLQERDDEDADDEDERDGPAGLGARDMPFDATLGGPTARLLVVYDRARPETLAAVRAVVRDSLDVPAPQILIESSIIEINTSAEKAFGFTWDASDGRVAGSAGLAADGSLLGGAALPLLLLFEKGADFLSTFRARLDARIAEGTARILSRPTMLTLDGRPARMRVGSEIPIVTATLLEGGGVAQDVTYVPIGLTLDVVPRIGDDGASVTLQVDLVASLSESALVQSVVAAPTIESREVHTQVRVPDRTPLLIGGLVAESAVRDAGRVPGLSRLPGVGRAFRRTQRNARTTELIVLITPHVVPARHEAASPAASRADDVAWSPVATVDSATPAP